MSVKEWLMPGSQAVKGEECSKSVIPNSFAIGFPVNSLVTW